MSMTHDKHKIFNGLIILLPIIDLLTSLMTRYTDSTITLGVIVKSAMMIYFTIYMLILTNSKRKKFFRVYLLIILAYIVLYFLFKPYLITENFILSEMAYMMKIFFLPIMFGGLICFFDDSGFSHNTMNKVLFVNMILYLILFILPILTNTSFNTYIDGSKGIIGWFYAGNEISAICVVLFPFLYLTLKSKKYSFIILILVASIIFSLIGTKVILFGSIIVCILVFIESILKKSKINSVITIALSIIIVISIMMQSASVQNMNKIISSPTPDNDIILEEPVESNKYVDILLKLLSGRDKYIIATHNIYVNNLSPQNVFFGIGYSNTSNIQHKAIEKLIEIDIIDLFYHSGIIGLILNLFPMFYCLYIFFKSIFQKRLKLYTETYYYGMMILLICGISCISGHVLLNPAVSIYLIIYLIYFLNSLSYFEKEDLVDKKVQILSLHLGYGGAERATIDLANMLSKKYDVELISLYKTVDTPPYEIDKRVKVSYLTNMRPNKTEFKSALSKKKYIRVLLEGIKSIHILFIKHNRIKGVVEYSNAKYLISSRLYFTKLLNNYGRQNIKIISIEHNYEIADTYISKLNKYSKNINSLVCVSRQAAKIYSEKLLNLDITYIPNVVGKEYNSRSHLNNNDLIYVGRLEPEKGVLDLIEITEKIKITIPDIKLDIYGEGSQLDMMKKLTKEKDLESNIIFHGFKAPEDLKKAYAKSSLFVLPSHKESFGIVILEAMSCGVPTIAFDEATGAKDIIENKIDGYIIKNRNIDEMVEQTIKYLKSSKKEKESLQKKAIKKVNAYKENSISKEWYKLLERL